MLLLTYPEKDATHVVRCSIMASLLEIDPQHAPIVIYLPSPPFDFVWCAKTSSSTSLWDYSSNGDMDILRTHHTKIATRSRPNFKRGKEITGRSTIRPLPDLRRVCIPASSYFEIPVQNTHPKVYRFPSILQQRQNMSSRTCEVLSSQLRPLSYQPVTKTTHDLQELETTHPRTALSKEFQCPFSTCTNQKKGCPGIISHNLKVVTETLRQLGLFLT